MGQLTGSVGRLENQPQKIGRNQREQINTATTPPQTQAANNAAQPLTPMLLGSQICFPAKLFLTTHWPLPSLPQEPKLQMRASDVPSLDHKVTLQLLSVEAQKENICSHIKTSGSHVKVGPYHPSQDPFKIQRAFGHQTAKNNIYFYNFP